MSADRFRVVPAAYVFFRKGEDVLLQLRVGTGFMDGHWAAAAAGHVEQYESVFDAARREANEELGLDITSDDLRPLTAMHRTAPGHAAVDERVDFFFECWSWDGEPRRIETHKSADLGWFSLDALPHPVVPHELLVLERMHAGTLDPVVSYGF